MIHIFAGPTLGIHELQLNADLVFKPPVKHGDILDSVSQNPTAIGIIDGYFEGFPSVWHKEILYALDKGIPVYGSSSMGALRASELQAFGMIGIGQIFEWYRDGVICDDDEVAVLHGPEETGFIKASVPMVNIRATLQFACKVRVIDEQQCALLIDAAKNTFYKQRTWLHLLTTATTLFKDSSLTERLSSWLELHAIDQKKLDAQKLLYVIEQYSENPTERTATFDHFEWTQAWDEAFERHIKKHQPQLRISEHDKGILEQLSLQPEEFEKYRDKASLRYMVSIVPQAYKNPADTKKALDTFRADNALRSRTQLLNYLTAAGLEEAEFEKLLERVSDVEQLVQNNANLQAEIINELKLSGRYLELLEMCQKKSEFAQRSADYSELSEVQQLAMVHDYFKSQLNRTLPHKSAEILKNTVFTNIKDFYSTIALDCLYRSDSD